MQNSNAFARSKSFFAAIAAVISGTATPYQVQLNDRAGSYRSRGKGEGFPGNKHAKSSFKQNKRRGL